MREMLNQCQAQTVEIAQVNTLQDRHSCVRLSETLPICILSCNRPRYLSRCLEGLQAAMRETALRCRVALFQDRPASESEPANAAIAAECAQIFQHRFPQSSLFIAELNLGIAGNYRRAEAWAFQQHQDSCKSSAPVRAAFFLEDDFVLNGSSLCCIDHLLELDRQHLPVGAVSVAGHLEPWHPGAIRPMGQLWAYALTRAAYDAIRPMITQYDKLVMTNRPSRSLQYPPLDHCLELGWSWGFEAQAGDRDSFIAMALNCMGYVQVASNGMLGRYIGIEGESFDVERFSKLGWDNQQEISVVPSMEQIIESFRNQQSLLQKHQQDQFNRRDSTFYSDACTEAYNGGRFTTCRTIAEKGLEYWGSSPCRGFPFCFERHLIKALTRLNQLHAVQTIAARIVQDGKGTWAYWAIASALEDAGKWSQALSTWQTVLAWTPGNQAAMRRLELVRSQLRDPI